MGGHGSLVMVMVMVWVWVQIQRKMLGSGTQALVIIKLNNIFPLHTKLQDPHLKYPMCYTKCHNVNNVSLRKVFDVDE
jgi:hypothetical protein